MATKAKARDANRRVDFSELGTGVYLVLRNSGIRALQTKHGPMHIKTVNDAFLVADVEILEHLLSITAHKGDELIEINFDDIDNVSMQLLTDRLRDAWCLAIHGMTFEEQVAHLQKLMKEAEGETEKPDPLPLSPGAGSDTSSEQPSGQA